MMEFVFFAKKEDGAMNLLILYIVVGRIEYFITKSYKKTIDKCNKYFLPQKIDLIII